MVVIRPGMPSWLGGGQGVDGIVMIVFCNYCNLCIRLVFVAIIVACFDAATPKIPKIDDAFSRKLFFGRPWPPPLFLV